jgi:N-acetylglutamate synthase-like GNAT family acetyltransferase
MIDIVPFNDAYAEAFYRMNREWITENFVMEPLDEKVLSTPRASIIEGGGEIWFALHEGAPIGCYALLHHADGRVEFTKFAVDIPARGLGAGKLLFEHAIARATDIGAPDLILFTNTKQARACEMYYKRGFIKTQMSAAEKTRYARADLFMVLPLKEAA